jgi:hypothetical protein
MNVGPTTGEFNIVEVPTAGIWICRHSGLESPPEFVGTIREPGVKRFDVIIGS